MNIKSFFKLYTVPVLALFFGFGLYYIIFVGTNDQDRFSVSEPVSKIIAQDTEEKVVKPLVEDSKQSLKTDENGQNLQSDVSEEASLPIQNPNILSADTKTEMYIVLPKVINIRQSPNTLSGIVGKLFQNQKVEVEFATEGWAKVKDGWVLLKLLKQENPLENSKNVSILETYVVVPKSVNIRSEPSLSSKIMGKLVAGNTIEVEYVKDGWAKIKNGWVSFSLLKKQDNH
ncbi:hypothetical protein BKH41_05185 [Helicobacter sp. 12S02232-10]|uniref:SH3 domain-containing protein n=1 Tax=Helicobacter sp. 12S02232-10 TaxID=1476197 RepID=UPI000BA62968|nr:SH3 domain-containing protein [Helicobacter sp. 12S02232-10]PAF48665.1 hypothetical protein BKH41_05185 [Helicobacter sp. 12S02232-10]